MYKDATDVTRVSHSVIQPDAVHGKYWCALAMTLQT